MTTDTPLIPIHRTKEDQLRQWDCLFQIDNAQKKQEYGGLAIVVIALSLLVLLLFLLTPTASLVVVKGVAFMFALLAWDALLLFLLYLVVKRLKTKRNLRREIDEDLAQAKQYYLRYSEEGLQISSGDFTTDLSWQYFFARLETPTILLLFYKEGKHAFNAFSASEIGSDNLERLKALAAEKLPLLNERIQLKDRIKQKK